MGSSTGRLTPLQTELLEAFFAREQRFFLTGGGALVGFHLRHRESKDLDLFTHEKLDLDAVERAVVDAAQSLGASVVSETRYPEFRRYLVRRGDDTTLVDLVVDRVPPVDAAKPRFGVVRVDSMREIAANKVCTLLSRCEIRDLVDLRALLAAGIDLEQALQDGARKDGGVNPAALAWLLDGLRIGAEPALPGGVSAEELERFRADLVRRLRQLAFPGGGRSPQ